METRALSVVVYYESWMYQLHYPTFKMNNLQWAFCTGFEGSSSEILENRPPKGSQAEWGLGVDFQCESVDADSDGECSKCQAAPTAHPFD